jgi:hypothetical protein
MTPNVAWSLLDRPRASLYRLAAPWLKSLYADRTRRVFWLAVFSIASSLVLTVAAPLWVLALGPLVLGVPHLLADLRYLVVRPGLHRRRALWFSVPPLLAMGFSAQPWVGLLALGPVVVAGQGSAARRAVVLAGSLTLITLAAVFETPFLFAFIHLHNVVALGLWWSLRPRGRAGLVLVALAALATLWLLLGGADPLITALHGWTAPGSGASFEHFVATVAPLDDGVLGARLVLTFAFWQSLHYAAWLRLIPDDARPRAAPRPFQASWRALRQDFGRWPLLAAVAFAVGLAAWGAVDLAAARDGYLRLGAFHGYLELAVIGLAVVEARRP